MRAERLRRTKDIELVRAHGAAMSDRHFAMRARANGLDHVRIAVVSPRSVGGAVERHRARRRVREALRMAIRELATAPGTDLYLVTRTAALTAPFAELREALGKRVAAALHGGGA